jgi:integrase
MARTVRDSALESRTARGRLKARDWPYWRALDPGLHLGYRKPLGGGTGTWLRRRYDSEAKRYRHEPLGAADDFSDGDGREILSFAQAQRKAREYRAVQAAAGYTVANTMDDYFLFLEADGRTPDAIRDARYRDRAFVRPKLGTIQLSALTAERLKRWLHDLAKAGPRLRTAPGSAQKHRKVAGDEAIRARRATANRTWTVLRSALNKAFDSDKIDNDKAWRKVKPFRGVDTARVRYLTLAEAKRLDNSADSEFRPLVRAALHCGARYGQLIQVTVTDFNSDAGTLRLRSRKGDGAEKVYHCVLTDEGAKFFERACAGRAGGDLIFTKADGSAWSKSEQARPMAEACEHAKISPPVGFHGLRHTWASHAVMNGVPLLVVAKNLGHADTRMVEKHYGHLAPSYVADAIRTGAPRFGFKPHRNVVALPAGRRS